jgi:CheY-like chemotaxis protein
MVKILLVEDEEKVAQAQRQVLEGAGYRTDTVASGAAAMERMASSG